MFTLIIGNKNYSSWSLRPWLVLKMLDEPFKEQATRTTPLGRCVPGWC
ncbi:hypothetical protein PWG14_09945 (plasmid) [Chromobacterium amazonense]|nr:hypothetical protein [Chromobacterium amazonense]MDE1712959.1 hypothetical protein [Chromobacterium amazonense]